MANKIKKKNSSKVSTKTASEAPKASDAQSTAATAKRAKKPATKQKKPASKSSTSSSTLPTAPTEVALNSLSQYPPLSSADTSRMLHVPPSFADVARQVIAIWQSLGGELNFPGLSLDVLIEALATYDAVAPIEAEIVPFYQRASSTRIKAAADAAGMMFTLARAVKGVGDTGMAQRFAVLSDWIAKNHRGNRGSKKAAKATKTA